MIGNHNMGMFNNFGDEIDPDERDNWHKEEFPEYHDSLTNRMICYTLLSYKYICDIKNKFKKIEK